MKLRKLRFKRLNCIRFFIISLITAFAVFAFPLDALAAQLDGRSITSRAAVVIDYETGVVIYGLNMDTQRVPASMTKVLAVYVVLDAINDGLLDFDTLIHTSDAISRFSFDTRFSNVRMPQGSSFTVRDLICAVMNRSAGAATVALGEELFGSEEAFVARMNEKVIELGLVGEFSDSWGVSAYNQISAYYMAQLARSIIKNHPVILEISSPATVFFDGVAFNNTNALLGRYYGMDGLKTGFTRAAGWCFVGTAMVDGRRIIAVTMGSDQGERFYDTIVLMDYGFDHVNRAFAEHFRAEVEPPDIDGAFGSGLVPASFYSNVETVQFFDFLELASILNEN